MSDPLYTLLMLSLISACLLILISAAMVGRKLADLDYQRASGINGTSRLQGVINLRTHSMRVLVGVTFGVFAILLLADAPMLWRQWVNRTLFVLVPLGYVVASALDWLAEREQMRIEIADAAKARTAAAVLAKADEDHRMNGMAADMESYRQMTAEAIEHLEEVANRSRAAIGEPPLVPLAPVVPEHQSPVTAGQAETGRIATMRARLVAANKALGIEPAQEKET